MSTTLTSASTLSDIIAEIVTTADYEAEQDAAKAARHLTALNVYLIKAPDTSTDHEGRSLKLNAAIADGMRKEVRAWLAIHGATRRDGARVLHSDFRNFRE